MRCTTRERARGPRWTFGLNDLLSDRGRSAVSDQDLLCGPDEQFVFGRFDGWFREHIPLCERPDGCRAVLCESVNVVDGPLNERRKARSKKETVEDVADSVDERGGQN